MRVRSNKPCTRTRRTTHYDSINRSVYLYNGRPPEQENSQRGRLEYRSPEKRGYTQQAQNNRQQQHKKRRLPIGMEQMAQRVEPDDFLLGVIVWLVRIVANRNVGVRVTNNGTVGQPVRVLKDHAVDEHQQVESQQQAGNRQTIWEGG